jgi:hypothetical protein
MCDAVRLIKRKHDVKLLLQSARMTTTRQFPSPFLAERLEALGVPRERQTRHSLWLGFAKGFGLTERIPESISTDEVAEFAILVLELEMNAESES